MRKWINCVVISRSSFCVRPLLFLPVSSVSILRGGLGASWVESYP